MRPVLVIRNRDTVATALVHLEPGRCMEIDGLTTTARDAIPAGHKMAIADIAAGEAVVKYGSPIGVASADIAAPCAGRRGAASRARWPRTCPRTSCCPSSAVDPTPRRAWPRIRRFLQRQTW